jgi:uncharacterized protein (UPF0248 family)
MEYRSLSTKLPMDELTLFKSFCERKGVSPASLIRNLILREMKITVPHIVAGKNKIQYDKKMDSFTWLIELDDGKKVEVLKNVSPSFIEDLQEIITLCLEGRYVFIHKKKNDSIAIPSGILRGKR